MASPSLFWTPFSSLHALIAQGGPIVKIELAFDSLVQSVAFFAAPNDSSRKIVMEQSSTQFNGKKFAIEASLKPATMQLSALLDLDELQTHILLKRYLKESSEDEAALETARAANRTMDLSLEAMTSVLSFYFDERIALLKATQSILMLGIENKDFKSLTDRLIKSDLEGKTLALIRSTLALLGPAPGSLLHSAGAIVPFSTTAGDRGLYARMAAVTKAMASSGDNVGAKTISWLSSSHSAIRDQLYRECCELLSILFFMYELPGPPLGSQCSGLQALELVKIGSSLFPSDSNQSSETEALSIPLNTVAGGGASARLAEQLVSLLILSALDLPSFIFLSSKQPPTSSAADVDGPIVPLASCLADINREIKGWRGAEANALLLLTWSSIAKLVEPYHKDVSDAASDLQVKAMSCGLGFTSMIRSLQQVPGLSNSAFGQLARNLIMKALAVIGTAYELGPSTLTRELLYEYIDLLHIVVAGDASLCSAIWDDTLDLTQPIRSLLVEARDLFPADTTTLVKLLLVCSEGPEATAAAYKFLQSVSHLSILHDLSDQKIVRSNIGAGDDETVTLSSPTVWNLAPSVSTMILPDGIEGLSAPLPAIFSDLELSKRLVQWDVKGTHSSFGQLLLLGRAAHCLSVVDHCLRSRESIDQACFVSLLESTELVARFCSKPASQEFVRGGASAIVEDLMTLSIDLPSSKCTWLDIAASSASVLMQLALAGFRLPPGSVQRCFAVMESIATLFPLRVMASIQSIHLLCPSRSFGAEAGKPPLLTPLPTAVYMSLSDASLSSATLGLLPGWTAFITESEAKDGDYSSLIAFLDLVTSLLEMGHIADPLPGHVLFVLHDIIPLLQRLLFKNAAAGWKVKSSILRLLDAALPAGAASDISLADQGVAGLGITRIAAHVISHSLLQGPTIISSCLLPAVDYLEFLKASDPAGASVAEGTCRAFLQLVTKLLVSTAAWRKAHRSTLAATELPFESFLLRGDGNSRPPLSLVTSLISYHQCDADGEEPTLATLAVDLLGALVEAGRGVTSSSFTAAVASALSLDKTSLQVIRMVFKIDPMAAVDAASAPLITSVVNLIETACLSPVASDILDILLFPTGLDPCYQKEELATLSAPPPSAEAAPSSAPALASEGPKATAKPQVTAWSLLDSLHELMSRTTSILSGPDEVRKEILSQGIRAMSCLWQLGGAPVHFLRLQPLTWSSLGTCLANEGDLGGGGEDLWLLASRTHAWRIMLLEVHLTKRPQPSDASNSSSFWKLLDSLIQNGTLCRAIQSSTLKKSEAEATLMLSYAVKACFLELGASFFGLGSTVPEECHLPIANLLWSDIELLSRFVQSSHLDHVDIGPVHRRLSAGLVEDNDDADDGIDRDSKALLDWIQKTPLGLSILNQCSETNHFQAKSKLGNRYLLSTKKLSTLLGSCMNQPSTESLHAGFAKLNMSASFVTMRLGALQAASMLASSLTAKDTSSFRPVPKDILNAAVEAALANTSLLIKYFATETITRDASLPSLFLPACTSLSLSSWRLLVLVLGMRNTAHPKLSQAHSSSYSQGQTSLFPYGAPRVASIPEARTLFPATPSPSSRQQTPTSNSDPSSSSDLATHCFPICSLLGSWFRNAVNGNLGTLNQVVGAEVIEISNAIMTSALLILTNITRGLDSSLVSVLSGALPHLSSLCMESETSMRGVSVPVAIQLVTEIVRLLPSQEWLPILRTHIDLPSLISRSMSNDGIQGEVGMLQLAALVAQSTEGARSLMEQGALAMVTDAARAMLSVHGGGLAPFASLDLPLYGTKLSQARQGTWDSTAVTMTSRPPISQQQPVDTSLAYKQSPVSVWSPLHQQWCVLLSLSSTLLRSLGLQFNVEAEAIDFLSTAESRLLLACMPPPATTSQPLAIAMLLETEKVFFLLSGLSRYTGSWQVMMPGSLSKFRTVASSFVAFAASVSAKTPPLIFCSPQSAAEEAMSKSSGLLVDEGWFKACDVGSQRPGSEYSTRLAELVYSCLYLSLSFLMASSPQLGDGEGNSLGPMWPRSRDLCIIQDQCMAVVMSLLARDQVGVRSEAEARKKHVGQLMLKVLHAATAFLSIIGYPPVRRGAELNIKEQIRGLEESLASGEIPSYCPGMPLSPDLPCQ